MDYIRIPFDYRLRTLPLDHVDSKGARIVILIFFIPFLLGVFIALWILEKRSSNRLVKNLIAGYVPSLSEHEKTLNLKNNSEEYWYSCPHCHHSWSEPIVLTRLKHEPY